MDKSAGYIWRSNLGVIKYFEKLKNFCMTSCEPVCIRDLILFDKSGTLPTSRLLGPGPAFADMD